MWEPSWEPTSANSHRRPWTQTESKLLCSRLNGLRWTPRDAAWRSTDQKVGGSSPPERAPVKALVDGHSCVSLDESGDGGLITA